MKAIFWHDETMGADYTVEEIPAGLVEEAEEWRDKMLEKIAEFDDALMEKYFDDPSTITEEEIRRALRNATLKMEVVPMICGSSFKNKGVQCLLDAVCAYLPSPLDSGAVEGTNPDNPDEVETREPPTPMLAVSHSSAFIPAMSSPVAMYSTAVRVRKSVSAVFSRCIPTSRTLRNLLIAVI